MTKPLKYIVAIALILFLIYYFLQKPKTNHAINKVTFVEQTQSNAEKVKPKIPKKIIKEEDQLDLNSKKHSENKIDDRNVSYLTAYRELKSFFKCAVVIQNNEKGIDLMKSYMEKTSYFSSNDGAPKEVQTEYYQVYIDKCQSLFLTENESVKEAYKRIEKRFNNSTPVSDDEVSLANALEIENRIKNLTRKISQEKSGKTLLTEAEQRNNIKRLLAISEEMTPLINRSMTPEFTETDEILLNNLLNEIRELNNTNTHLSNPEEVKLLQEELALVTPELVEFFKNNQTPDVFLIFAEHLLNERRGQFFFTEDVNNKLGIYDTDYINALNKIIVPFIACSLGYPCGAESFLVIEHCIYPFGGEPLACGRNIEDYYLEDLISPNQMIDFNNYFNYLLDNYAQL